MLFKKNKKPSIAAAQTKAPAAKDVKKAKKVKDAEPQFNDLEAEFIGTYHAGRALRMAYIQQWFLGGFALLFAVLYFAFPRTVTINHYIATEPNGTIMPIVTYNKPFDTDSAVISWTEQAVTGIFNFDVLDYRRRMESAQKDFTRVGFATFLKQFKKNGLYADMEARKLMISAVQSGTAVIRLQGLNPQGVYAWQVQIPLHLRLENSNGISDKKYLATVIVQRVANWKNPRAIAISSISLIKE
ncbi:DotI/IcmL family type IV secretion protein [Acidithiobacillus sp. M4-SHS-6]|uniref:DotI/IcmL family type IV secretion protein n=1 Tax=Acidithiobacillus sp. M4-SHS-6 TaxID=3383024 RepID=UPI0039BEB9EA